MSKKGVPIEEKKTRLLQLFYETGECYQLKELEKVAPKAKGIVANSVKDVVQKLTDDGLIETDKIGNSVFLWAFPSKVIKSRKRQLDDAEIQYEEQTKKIKLIDEMSRKSDDNDDKKVDDVMVEITDLELELATLKKTLQSQQDNDPAKFELMQEKSKLLKEAANRWTDNVFAIKTWIKKKFMTEDNIIDKQFGIPADFDYIE